MSGFYPGQGHGPGHHHQGPPQYGLPPQQGYGYGGYNQGAPQHYPPPHQQQYPTPQGYGYGPPPQQQYGSPAPFNAGPGYGPPRPAPPQGQQQFGQGAPQHYTFQYSNCTGRRKALLIGINYFGSNAELKGCINDTRNVSSFLMERYGYKREDMVILTDDQTSPVLQPTKANIERGMKWLVQDARPNDSLFLHYSGHGGQTKDLDGDEDDGYDETIYPVDFKQNGHIVDDSIHEWVVMPLQPGVRLTAIFDSCHSGSVMDLPYVYSTKGVLKEPNLAKEVGQGLLQAAMSYMGNRPMDAVKNILGTGKMMMQGNSARDQSLRTKTSPADVILWSGSKDDQTSADATIAAQATGAMSWAFITAIKQNPNQTYLELLNSVRDVLQSKYTQKPQLSCSHPLDVNLRFIM